VKKKTTQSTSRGIGQLPYLLSGAAMVIVGLIASSSGSVWSPPVYAFLADIETVQTVGTYVPYFPFVPFFPVFLIMFGAALIVKSRQ
jgi:energy-converting hydrogenase Eha subunit E